MFVLHTYYSFGGICVRTRTHTRMPVLFSYTWKERILSLKLGMVAKHDPTSFSIFSFTSKVFQWYVLFDLFWLWALTCRGWFYYFTHLSIYPSIHPFFHPSVHEIIFEHIPCLRHHSARWKFSELGGKRWIFVLALPLTQFPQRGEMTWWCRALCLWHFIICLKMRPSAWVLWLKDISHLLRVMKNVQMALLYI